MRPCITLFSCFALATLAQPCMPADGADGAALVAPQAQTRCGWFDNPTPNNVSLTDRDGEWAIAVQGKFEAEGDWPKFRQSQWISSGNASYGRGCACMRVVTDPETRRITSILSATARPLAACRRDKSLKRLSKNQRQEK